MSWVTVDMWVMCYVQEYKRVPVYFWNENHKALLSEGVWSVLFAHHDPLMGQDLQFEESRNVEGMF